MGKLSLIGTKELPATFRQHNQVKAQRTVELTRQAIAKLKADGRPVTLVAVAEATRAVDESGKGLAPNTILRNAAARELFHQASASYQARQARVQKVKRRRSPPRSQVIANLAADYRGLRASDLIQIIEQLQQTVEELRTRQNQLAGERDTLSQCCDDLRQQNTRQLAALTNLQKPALN